MKQKNRLIKFKKDFLYRYNDQVRGVETVMLISDVNMGEGIFEVRSVELLPELGREDSWESSVYVSPELMEVIGHKEDYPEYFI
jgi:hypothetical protein